MEDGKKRTTSRYDKVGTPGKRLIVRYGNRKMYDTQESNYVNLSQLAELIRSGTDVEVISGGKDVTAFVLAQILVADTEYNDLSPTFYKLIRGE